MGSFRKLPKWIQMDVSHKHTYLLPISEVCSGFCILFYYWYCRNGPLLRLAWSFHATLELQCIGWFSQRVSFTRIDVDCFSEVHRSKMWVFNLQLNPWISGEIWFQSCLFTGLGMLALFSAGGGGFQGLQCSQKFSVLHGESGWPFFCLGTLQCTDVGEVLCFGALRSQRIACSHNINTLATSVPWHHRINVANALWDFIL